MGEGGRGGGEAGGWEMVRRDGKRGEGGRQGGGTGRGKSTECVSGRVASLKLRNNDVDVYECLCVCVFITARYSHYTPFFLTNYAPLSPITTHHHSPPLFPPPPPLSPHKPPHPHQTPTQKKEPKYSRSNAFYTPRHSRFSPIQYTKKEVKKQKQKQTNVHHPTPIGCLGRE